MPTLPRSAPPEVRPLTIRMPEPESSWRHRWTVTALEDLVTRPANQAPALDALRAAAVLLVIGGHYVHDAFRPALGLDLPIASSPIFVWGWTGVDLFFVLSGFFIGRQVWREVKETGSMQVGRFLLRRGLRIWPLYFAFLGYLLLAEHAGIGWPDVLFYSNYVRGGFVRGWSLSTEEQFYIVVPAVIALAGRRLKLGHYLWLLGGALVATILARANALAAPGIAAAGAEGLPREIFDAFHLHCDALLVGLFLALVSVLRPRWLAPSRSRRIHWPALSVAALAAVTGLLLRALDQRLFSFTALALIFGGLTAWLLVDRSWLSRPLHARAFYPISRLSYGMYLNHILVAPWALRWCLVALQQAFGRPLLTFFLGGLITLGVSVVLAVIGFVLVEYPGLRLREWYLARARTRRAAPVVLPAGTAAAGG